jgi:hypothetical protein
MPQAKETTGSGETGARNKGGISMLMLILIVVLAWAIVAYFMAMKNENQESPGAIEPESSTQQAPAEATAPPAPAAEEAPAEQAAPAPEASTPATAAPPPAEQAAPPALAPAEEAPARDTTAEAMQQIMGVFAPGQE